MLLFVDLTSLYWLFAGCLCSVSRDFVLVVMVALYCWFGLGNLFVLGSYYDLVGYCLLGGWVDFRLVVWVGYFCLFVLLIVVLPAIRRLWWLIVLMLCLSYSIWWFVIWFLLITFLLVVGTLLVGCLFCFWFWSSLGFFAWL